MQLRSATISSPNPKKFARAWDESNPIRSQLGKLAFYSKKIHRALLADQVQVFKYIEKQVTQEKKFNELPKADQIRFVEAEIDKFRAASEGSDYFPTHLPTTQKSSSINDWLSLSFLNKKFSHGVLEQLKKPKVQKWVEKELVQRGAQPPSTDAESLTLGLAVARLVSEYKSLSEHQTLIPTRTTIATHPKGKKYSHDLNGAKEWIRDSTRLNVYSRHVQNQLDRGEIVEHVAQLLIRENAFNPDDVALTKLVGKTVNSYVKKKFLEFIKFQHQTYDLKDSDYREMNDVTDTIPDLNSNSDLTDPQRRKIFQSYKTQIEKPGPQFMDEFALRKYAELMSLSKSKSRVPRHTHAPFPSQPHARANAVSQSAQKPAAVPTPPRVNNPNFAVTQGCKFHKVSTTGGGDCVFHAIHGGHTTRNIMKERITLAQYLLEQHRRKLLDESDYQGMLSQLPEGVLLSMLSHDDDGDLALSAENEQKVLGLYIAQITKPYEYLDTFSAQKYADMIGVNLTILTSHESPIDLKTEIVTYGSDTPLISKIPGRETRYIYLSSEHFSALTPLL